MIKSLAYKVFWAGRYLERIENICRMYLLAIDKCSPTEVPLYLGVNEDIRKYLVRNLEMLREDLRAFSDEKVMNAVATLEGAIYSSNSDLKSYFSAILQSVLYLGSIIEDEIKPVQQIIIPKKQEEVKTQ
ncbi:MAG: alpha-E domain-containing protein [Sulfolobus sp.]